MKPTSIIPVKNSVIQEIESVKIEMVENSPTESASIAAIFPIKSVYKKMTKEELNVIEKENIMPNPNSGYADWEDLDLEDTGDILMISEYVVEIFDYMNHLEVNHKCAEYK